MTNLLSLGGHTTDEILLNNRDLADRILREIASTNPEAHGSGSASTAADIRWAVDHGLRAAASALAGIVEHDELMIASAARRFEEGSSFASVLIAHHRGISVVWDELRSCAGDQESVNLSECARRLFGHIERVASALAESFERTLTMSHLGERDSRFALFTALTQGGDAELEARRSGQSLASNYGILAIRIRRLAGTSPGSVLDHQATQRLRISIDSVVKGDVLTVLGPTGGTALVPLTASESVRPELQKNLRERFGDDFIAAWVETDVPALGEALRVAEEMVDLAQTLRSPGLVYTLDELALEYQSARPGPARALLARALQGLSDELLATIDAYLSAGASRRLAAERLQLHPNSIDYRLGRVATLTGMDASSPNGAARLRAARVAQMLESQ